MKKEKEVLPVYNEVIKCSRGWKLQFIVDGKVKFMGLYKTQKSANNKYEKLTKEK
jgi:hypothetical protein